ncbi:helix-turn-helix domain-containing protein [Paenibacillus sp. FSL H7-0331]|uniref:helix-turn-helix domain-containing protein n=1 Tax=Paenibacillus sp. FSL H7-0331 TaxID=1920421 RepID=UPI00096E506F|nr:helix-turn-helix domain-containing protein [Paenibacillus sp. FSL H7-0331]OMF11247.1 transcriptional regulator [Paenibacillus sp. FSL H7-0331]
MKFELGRCLLQDRLNELDMTLEELSRQLRYKPERILDYIDNQRVMPLKTAISIANSVGCNVQDLYELRPID